MKKLSAFFSFLILSSVYASTEAPLPMWIDHSREVKNRNITLEKFETLPPPASFRLPAEYEPVQAVVFGWRSYTTMLKQIAQAAANYGKVQIWAFEGPTSIAGVPQNQYKRLDCPLNTVWMRDYGPFGINEANSTIGIVDTVYRHYQYRQYDDQIPGCVADYKGVEDYPMGIILDGGNLMVDSKGNLFHTSRTYLWNSGKSRKEVDQILKEFFNVHTIHTIDYAGYPGNPADGTGHIDMFVKLLNDSTVLITKTDDEPFKTACENAVKYFQSIKAPNGRSYKILRAKGWSRGAWYTYTNSLIVNGAVIMPSYSGADQAEKEAIQAYEEGISGVKVIPVNSDSSIRAGGSVHCVTQQIPAI